MEKIIKDTNYKFIQTIRAKNLINWSVQYLIGVSFSYNDKFDLVRIGDFLHRKKTPINIENNTEYKRVTIKMKNGGVFLRDKTKGANIGTKKQFIVSEGQFLLSKIDARNGAFGVVPQEVDNAVITGNFWTFDVDYSKINPHFLSLITTTPEFIKFCEQSSNGTTNRHYLQENLFLDVQIPLPSIPEQDKLVKQYNKLNELAQSQEAQADELEKGIDEYLFKELGVNFPKKNNKIIGALQFFNFKELSRWDLLSSDNQYYTELKKSKYSLCLLGDKFNFVNRSWNKKNEKDKYFNYIEIGAIDPIFGITEIKRIEVKKAPSRATQNVKTDDLIIGTTRPYLRKFAIVKDEFDNYVCSSGFSVIEKSKSYDLEFLKHFLMSDFGLEQLRNKMSGGLYPAITEKELKMVEIPFPPVEKQQEISEQIQSWKTEIKTLREQAKTNREKAIKEFENEIFEN